MKKQQVWSGERKKKTGRGSEKMPQNAIYMSHAGSITTE